MGESTSYDPFPIVFRCPSCGGVVGRVEPPSAGEREARVPELTVPVAPLDSWLLTLVNDRYEGRRLFPSGLEAEILVQPHDWFFGVEKDWLMERLRLDPAISPLDLGDSHGFTVLLDDDEFELPDELPDGDFEHLLGSSPLDGELVTYGNGGNIGGRFDIVGGWVQDWSPEIRNCYTWLGADPDLGELATSYLSEGMEYWEPNEGELFEVTSPHLDAADPQDADNVLSIAGESGWVTLNGVSLRSPAE